ncbi:MAG TPA: hypothetical protein DEB20_05055 [Acidimicrobiaceae bacterium]|nr:hypothetical protein [Acidimicrobiaceae bacterium]
MPDLTESSEDVDAPIEAASTFSLWCERLAYALLAAVVATFAWKAATLDWKAAGDLSVIRLRALDVGTSNTPLVGPYSRFQWNHPGPSLSFAFAPWVRLFGTSGVGILIGAFVANLAAMFGAAWVARRSSKVLFFLTSIVLAAFVLLAQSGELFNPWNPFVVVLPLFAALIAAWGTFRGDRIAAVVLVIAASFAIQGHIGAAPLGVLALLIGGGGLLYAIVRSGGEDRRDFVTTSLIAVGVMFVCWIPPLLDQLFGTGNLGRLMSFQVTDTQPSAGLRFALDQVTRLLTFPPGREVGFLGVVGNGPVVPWMAIVLLAATVVAWKKGWHDRLQLALVAWLSIAVTGLAISGIKGIPFQYVFRWSWAMVLVVWIACAWVGVSLLLEFAPVRRWFTAGASLVLAGLLGALLLFGVSFRTVQGWDEQLRLYEPLMQPTLDVLQEAPKPVMVVTYLGLADGTVANELLARGDELGLDLRRTPELTFIFGSKRSVDPANAKSELVLATRGEFEQYRNDPRFTLIAHFDPFTAEERVEYNSLLARYRGREGDTTPDPDLQRYRQLAENPDEIWVYYADTPPVVAN